MHGKGFVQVRGKSTKKQLVVEMFFFSSETPLQAVKTAMPKAGLYQTDCMTHVELETVVTYKKKTTCAHIFGDTPSVMMRSLIP